jgi:hypothetical protein
MAGASKKAFALRLDPHLHAAVERLAASELRSVNAQIEFLVRDALRARGILVNPRTPEPEVNTDPGTP